MKRSTVRTPPKASLVSLGCPMNQVDSERIISGLVARGFEIVAEEDADVIVVNTCGFIESAREESVGSILSSAELKDHGNLKALVVAGCLAERYRDELVRDFAEVDAVVGLGAVGTIPDVCCELLGRTPGEERHGARVLLGPPNMAYLKIAEGCNHRCTFCAIPMIRGKFRSVPAADVLREARELADLGIRELVLVGQDTTSYGSDLAGEHLAGLLEKLNDLDGIGWIRLMYAHPAHLDDELIAAFRGLSKLVPYIDMPVQHISGRVLRTMGRPTSPEKIRGLLDRLRTEIPDLILRTTLITGFPGETDRDFRELLAFVEEYRFERLGAFVFSPEEDTPAADYEDVVPEDLARERYEELMEVQARIAAEFHSSLVGREFDLIVDRIDPETGVAIGRTYMDAPEIDGNVSVPCGVKDRTDFYRVRITGAGTYDLEGEVIL